MRYIVIAGLLLLGAFVGWVVRNWTRPIPAEAVRDYLDAGHPWG